MRWKRIRQKLFYRLLKLTGWCLATMPQAIVEHICRNLGDIAFRLPLKWRRIVLSNLTHAFPLRPMHWRKRIARESFRRLFELGFFALASPHLSKTRIRRQYSLGPESIELLPDRSSVVGLSPHLSNMEVVTLLNFLTPHPIPPTGIIFRPSGDVALDRYIKKTRERGGVELLSRKSGFNRALQILRDGGSVGVLFDQNAGDRGALTLFMNRLASTTELPGLLAEKFKSRVMMVYPERRGFWRAQLRGTPLPCEKTQTAVTLAADQWLEHKLASDDNFCADWLWMHGRWRAQDDANRRLRIQSKRSILKEALEVRGLTHLPRTTPFVLRMSNWLGDLAMVLPLLRAMRAGRPDGAFTIMAQPGFVAILKRLDLGEHWIELPPKNLSYYWKIFQERARFPHTHILFTNSIRGDLEARIMGAPQRFGLVRHGHPRPLLTHSLQLSKDFDLTRCHQTHLWEKMLRHFGLDEAIDYTPFKWKSATQETQETIVGLICGTENSPEKRWPVEHWRTFLEAALKAHSTVKFRLFGTLRDRALTSLVAQSIDPQRVEDWAGRTDVLEFADRLVQCKAIVCNDTGGMHLANALGVPVVALYGPTNPMRTGPIFSTHKVIVQAPDATPTGGGTMAAITTNRVLEALDQLLSS